MSIFEFFSSINISITLDDDYIHENYRHIIDDINNSTSISDDHDYKRDVLIASLCMNNGLEYDNSMLNALGSSTDICNVYSTLFGTNDLHRTNRVLNDIYGDNMLKFDVNNDTIKKLQRIVDGFHSFEFEHVFDKMYCGFILSMIYLQIFPHNDNNGKMSRYMFIENNKLNDNELCPLSCVLCDFNICKIAYQHLIDMFTNTLLMIDDVISINITYNISRQIIYMIYVSKMYYKYIVSNCIHRYRKVWCTFDFEHIFCLGKVNNDCNSSSDVKLSEKHVISIGKTIEKLKNIFNYDSHSILISQLSPLVYVRDTIVIA